MSLYFNEQKFEHASMSIRTIEKFQQWKHWSVKQKNLLLIIAEKIIILLLFNGNLYLLLKLYGIGQYKQRNGNVVEHRKP